MFDFLKKLSPENSSGQNNEPEKNEWMGRLKAGLTRTSGQLTGLFRLGGKIDEELYDELETVHELGRRHETAVAVRADPAFSIRRKFFDGRFALLLVIAYFTPHPGQVVEQQASLQLVPIAFPA